MFFRIYDKPQPMTKITMKKNQKRLERLSLFIKELRNSECLTQEEVSEETQLHRNTVVRIENSQNFTILTLFQLADFYDLPASELLNDID
jgi:transcriptional regulator with XRE-family HTH domain